MSAKSNTHFSACNLRPPRVASHPSARPRRGALELGDTVGADGKTASEEQMGGPENKPVRERAPVPFATRVGAVRNRNLLTSQPPPSHPTSS